MQPPEDQVDSHPFQRLGQVVHSPLSGYHAFRHMAKRTQAVRDVLVIGSHPSALLAAILLVGKPAISVLHASPPITPSQRLVLINPEFFELHPALGALRRKLDMTTTYGLRFLSDQPGIFSESRGKSAMAYVASYSQVQQAMFRIAENAGVAMLKPAPITIRSIDETGLDATIGIQTVRARALILSDPVDAAHGRLLGIPEAWEPEVPHRYSFGRLKRGCGINLDARPIVPMSLNLGNTTLWSWLLPCRNTAQLAVCQPRESSMPAPEELLRRWVKMLREANILGSTGGDLPLESVESCTLPLAGAMAHEGVANRALLIGPAGGFYSASAEDIYPNCWSAVFAAEVIQKALREQHLQDALQPFRHRWRTTLGEYLRGPQQNLRFLLPLIYRNQVMATRLTESILLGKSVVHGK